MPSGCSATVCSSPAAIVALAGLLAIAQAVARHLAPRRDDADVLAAIGLTTADRRRAGLLAVGPGLARRCAGRTRSRRARLSPPPARPGPSRRSRPRLPRRLARARRRVRRRPRRRVGCAPSSSCAVGSGQPTNDEPVAHHRSPAWPRRSACAPSRRSAPTSPSPVAEGGPDSQSCPTLAVLAATTAIVAGALAIRSSLDGLAGDAERYGQPWDVFVDVDASEQRDAGERLAADPRVAGVEAMHSGEVDLGGDDSTVRQVAAIGLEGLDGPDVARRPRGQGPGWPGRDRRRHEHDAVARPRCRRPDDGQRAVRRAARRGGRAQHRAAHQGDDPDSGVVLPLSTFDELCAGRLIADLDEQVGVIVRLHDDDDARRSSTALEGEHWAVDIEPVPSSVSVLADVRQVPVLLAVAIAVLWLMVVHPRHVPRRPPPRRRPRRAPGARHASRRRPPCRHVAGDRDGCRHPLRRHPRRA